MSSCVKMKIEKIVAEKAVELSPHNHPFLNPYNGCPMGCPFCFWLNQKGWEGRIQIKENIEQRLSEYLEIHGTKDFLYLGSVCDPFMEIEKDYGLTGRCLEIIRGKEVPLLITTSAACDVIQSYSDLLKSMPQRVIVVVELSRIPLIEQWKKGGVHVGIENANQLSRAGIETWATASPVLPGITDLGEILEALDESIPIYTDCLCCREDEIQGKRVLEWIGEDYPELLAGYEKIVREGDNSYYIETLEKLKGNNRIKSFPFQLE